MGLYTLFFAELHTDKTLNTQVYEQIITNKIQYYSDADYWKMFGYTYFGVFKLVDKSRDDMIAEISNQQTYARRIIESAYLPVEIDKHVQGIITDIKTGMDEFASSGIQLTDEQISYIQTSVIRYFQNKISKFDEMQLMHLHVKEKINGSIYNVPVNRAGRMHMGIINPWPGDLSAESEVVIRIKRSAEEVGIKITMLSDWGHILDETTQKKTDEFVDATQLDYAITTHYLDPKTMDTFYYHPLWNPPEIPLNLGEYNQYITNNYIMNDDYLTYDMGGMRNHLKTMLMNKPRSIEGTSMLTASFPESSMISPKLDDPKLFYCGMNWDKLVNHQNRHEGLFKLLDQTGKVKFFGPDVMKNWGGIRPWEGYKCYQHPIAWDGFSILKEVNDCGICLVISSDIHRRAGAVTNRAYEACAAGAVIISDNNEFMQKYFSDAALFIYYNRNDPQDTFNQIMEKYQWIIDNKEAAIQLAKKAQEIFREKFALDKQLLRIVENHPKRFDSIAGDLFAKDDAKTVLVTYVLNSLNHDDIDGKLKIVIRNISRQYYKHILFVVASDATVKDYVCDYLYKNYPDAEVEAMDLFDKKKIRKITDAQAIRIIQDSRQYDYYTNTSAREIWFYDHITSLVRSIEDDDAYGAYSGRLFLDSYDAYKRTDWFNVYSDAELSSVSDYRAAECPGQFLFTRDAVAYVPDYMCDNLDGIEHYAYACLTQIKYGKKLSFSKRMTIVDNGYIFDDRKTVVDYGMQARLIQDTIRFDLKEKKVGGENKSFNPLGQAYPDIMDMIKKSYIRMPFVTWSRYECMRCVSFFFGKNSKIGIKFTKKADRIGEEFLRKWQ